jgi:hypothetical protein
MIITQTIAPAVKVASKRLWGGSSDASFWTERGLSTMITSIAFVPVFVIAGGLTVLAVVAGVRSRRMDAIVMALFASAAYTIFIIFAAMTNNQPGTALALLVIAMLFAVASTTRSYPHPKPIFASMFLMLVIAGSIHFGWTETRIINDLDRTTMADATEASVIDSDLAHLQWALPKYNRGEVDAEKFRQLVVELREQRHSVVVFSDALIVHALAGLDPVAPTLFWHRGLSYPEAGTERADFDAVFKQRIVDKDARLILVDGEQTWMGTQYAEFPWLAACLQPQEKLTIGKFTLIPLITDSSSLCSEYRARRE